MVPPPFLFFIIIMWKVRVVFTVFLLTAVIGRGVAAPADTPQTPAAQSNRQLQLLIAKLPVCHDSTFYYNLVADIVTAAVRCDSLDHLPNAKGKVRPQYHRANAQTVGRIRHQLIDGGLYFYQKDNQRALALLQLYLSTQHHPLFHKQQQETGLASLYAGRIAYGMKDYALAERYADVALKDNDHAREAAQLKIYCMKTRVANEEDAQTYIRTLQALYEKDRANAHYRGLIIEFYSERGMHAELASFVDAELVRHHKDKLLWALKGETEMQAHRWDVAINAYQHAVAQDSLFLPALYNIGICYTSKAIQIRDSIETAGGQITQEQTAAIRQLLADGRPYLEKARRLDPQRHTVDWAPPLYQVYYALGDPRAEEVKRLIKM